ncbi:adenosine deaminase/editase [Gamsiella multidivaricata]|uniref:adenosine deaminase/editase n=1 Tax=Gamsiella multidivaricata TaxID=101098 RepID=UPI0022208E52|nr:adenosine deaminase/editase [Gamsiella multidivaricata]KAI7823891.1 adenosine deaminase/editase [Gamsiella multidivaricata]
MPRYPSQELIHGIARECHDQFNRLPKHGKPSRKSNGQAEWTILAGIVLATPTAPALSKISDINGGTCLDNTDEPDESWEVECISLATGSRCLPQGKLSPRGDLVNDCHAEVLARRGFNKWCLSEMQACISYPENMANRFRYLGNQDTPLNKGPLFQLADPRTQFHLYVSQAPCGDATTSSLAQTQTEESRNAFMNGQQARVKTQQAQAPPAGIEDRQGHDQGAQSLRTKRPLDSTEIEAIDLSSPPPPKQTKLDMPSVGSTQSQQTCHHALGFRRGRIDYDSVGVLRTKPGRVDSEPTASMSCSDKIARWNVLGLTSALVAPFLGSIYLQSVIARELFDATALDRALNERIKSCECTAGPAVSDPDSGSYHFHRVQVYQSPASFEFGKEAVSARSEKEGITVPPVACSTSISWIASEPSTAEVLVNGCKAGASAKQPLQPKSRSRVCKINMFKSSADLWNCLPESASRRMEKRDLVCSMRVSLKADSISYGEWKTLAKDHVASKERLFSNIFRHWIRSDKSLELFNINGNSLIKP